MTLLGDSKTAKLIPRSEVVSRTRLSYSTIWRLEKKGNFPARRLISSKRVAWVESEIEEWIHSCLKVT